MFVQVFSAYLAALSCPFPPSPPAPALDWLLSVAVQLEYADNGNKNFNLYRTLLA